MDKYPPAFDPQPPLRFNRRSSTGGAPTMSEGDPNGGEVIIEVPENKVRTD